MSRSQLEDLLAKLDAELPSMIRDHPDDADFWPAFAGEADVIEDAADAADYDWAMNAIDALLVKHGRPPIRDIPPTDSWPA